MEKSSRSKIGRETTMSRYRMEFYTSSIAKFRRLVGTRGSISQETNRLRKRREAADHLKHISSNLMSKTRQRRDLDENNEDSIQEIIEKYNHKMAQLDEKYKPSWLTKSMVAVYNVISYPTYKLFEWINVLNPMDAYAEMKVQRIRDHFLTAKPQTYSRKRRSMKPNVGTSNQKLLDDIEGIQSTTEDTRNNIIRMEMDEENVQDDSSSSVIFIVVGYVNC